MHLKAFQVHFFVEYRLPNSPQRDFLHKIRGKRNKKALRLIFEESPLMILSFLLYSMLYLPLFPLNLVVFPFEKVNLHIFEPRYRQLIEECLQEQSTFGLPPFIGKEMKNRGTQMRVLALRQRYEDGRMDITVEGLKAFELLDFQNPSPNKLYAGGHVQTLPIDEGLADFLLLEQVKVHIEDLYQVLKMPVPVDFGVKTFFSFEAGHKVGLSPEQEYELLCLPTEQERLQLILAHLEQAIPILTEIERTKERIQMNGHFKNFDPLNF